MIHFMTQKYQVIGQGNVMNYLGDGFYEVQFGYIEFPLIGKVVQGKLQHGDPVYYCYLNGDQNKPFLLNERQFAGLTTPGTPIGLTPAQWPQASGSIQKTWLGLSYVKDVTWPTNWSDVFSFTSAVSPNGREQYIWPLFTVGKHYHLAAVPKFVHVYLSRYRSGTTIFTQIAIYDVETNAVVEAPFNLQSTPVPQNPLAYPTWMAKDARSNVYIQDPVDNMVWVSVIAPCLTDSNGIPKNTAGGFVSSFVCSAFKNDPVSLITTIVNNTLLSPLNDPSIGEFVSSIYTGWMGSAHVAISGTRMIQAHPSCANIMLAERAGAQGLTWTVRATPDWYTLIPDMIGTPYQILPGTFCRTNPNSNNAPARVVESASTDIRDKFVFPSFTIFEDKWNGSYNNLATEKIGDADTLIASNQIKTMLENQYNFGTPIPVPLRTGTTFRSYLWAIYANSTNSVVTKEARKLVERTNPIDSEVRRLTGQMANASTYVQAQIEAASPGFFGSYSISTPVFDIVSETPTTFYDPTPNNTYSLSRTWGGVLDGTVTDLAGVQYPFCNPLKRHLRSILYPMPLGMPNDALTRDVGNQANLFDFCRWRTWSNTKSSIYTTLDPQIVPKENGTLYLCFLDSEWVMAGSRLEGSLSDKPSGFMNSSRNPCFVVNSYTWPGAGSHPNPYPQSWSSTAYSIARVHEVRKTKLIIAPKTGDPLIIDITKSFTGGFRIDLIDCPDELPIAENVWQIGLSGELLLLLKDDRDVAATTPYPVLEIRNGTTGALISTYDALVPLAIRNDRYTVDDVNNWTGECKWYLHGRKASVNYASDNTRPCPGPRFKHVWDGGASSPRYVYISVEGYEKRVGVVGAYTFLSRVDYTVLKISATGTVQLVSQQSATRSCSANSTTGTQHQQVLFPETLPRCEALIGASVTTEAIYMPVPTAGSPNNTWTVKGGFSA